MLNGFTTNLPADTLFGLGVVYIGSTKLGATRGAPRWDPGKQVRNTEYDGKITPVQGLDRILGWAPKLSLTLMEFGPAISGGQIARLEPGSAEAAADVNGTKVITMRDAEISLANGEYVTDLRVLWRRGAGGYAALHLPIAYCVKYDISGDDKDEARIACEFEARLSQADALADPGACPFRYEIRTAGM